MKKIYIAGFDVFKKDSLDIGKEYQNLCTKYGFIGLYPLDNQVDFAQEKQKIALDIFLANKAMIQQCDIIIANMNLFRGKEADSGTIWECGYAFAMGKKVYGYMDDTSAYVAKFCNDEKVIVDGVSYDNAEMMIEDFNHPINLMIACSSEIFQGNFENVLNVIKK